VSVSSQLNRSPRQGIAINVPVSCLYPDAVALYPVPVGTAGEFPVSGAIVGDEVDADTVTGSVAVVCGYGHGLDFERNIHGKFFLVKFFSNFFLEKIR